VSDDEEADGDEDAPLIHSDEQHHDEERPVPVSEMHAISFLGALRIPVSHLDIFCYHYLE